ncbi:MAG TPA: glycoside hydrolase family 3 C-terminal domain-containing protein, partial [Candidatus Dormibacteraeota bacterium]
VALVMAAYNSVNGASMTANPGLLRGLLKTEWEFPGVVVSDWSATRTTVQSAAAGLDLVMPGPQGPWGDLLVAAVRAGQVAEAEVDDKVARLLALARRVGALRNGHAAPAGNGAQAAVSPDLLRAATARSFVLLSNPHGLLPLRARSLRRVAVIGPNATDPQTQGGGSVRVLPVVRPGVPEALRAALGAAASVSIHQGCLTSSTVALPARGQLHDPVDGEPGVRLQVLNASGGLEHDAHHAGSAVTWWDGLPDAVHLPGSTLLMRGRFRAPAAGRHVLGGAGVGVLRLALDGNVLAEARTLPPRDNVEALSRPPELRALVDLEAGQEYEVHLELRPDVRGRQPGFVGLRLGIAPLRDDDALIADAVRAAAAADVAVVVVGSPDGAESEGFDRETLALSGRQDELVSRVAAANPMTVVVVNSGMPVLMPWTDEVAAILQVWFPGQAFGEALADVLLGTAEPGGRLPVTVPRAEADSPVLHAHPVAGELPYDEGLLVGYRGYDRAGREPQFSFGHGLGYTEWDYESLAAAPNLDAGEPLPLVVKVRNQGRRPGREVVQVYLEGPDDEPGRPLRVLGAFAGVAAAPGETAEAHLKLPSRLFARYDEERGEWRWQPGTYRLRAGRSSRDLRLSAEVVLR